MLTGTVKSYNPHKGWGFVECNGQDSFLNRKELKGCCPSKGQQVRFSITQTEKGPQAVDVTVVAEPDQMSYFGEIKSFNPSKGYGFIKCEAFPDDDIFVLRSELPGGAGPQGGHCRFKVAKEAKGPAAKDVMLLGAAGRQAQQMKDFGGYGYGGKGDFGKGGYSMGWEMTPPPWVMGGMPSMGMGMPWGKGFGKGMW
mmetsp:Transcript_84432/g.149372  ORF Transcript_84432/g.149372 Transcript_84432/m.149372 type:complete len:197 (+) Transcript_84432:92-682(+)|eukprot:CAMPEP_0197649000 /NCGR_PEP_ID=MMETSP1338-20131121/28093_1 /TAXON_ID=43686 ORGANISM="Pelagodinium beii, Strain RCC1491" /NCGR_SAMPLE_ID=MMETSP1338 /ASSEMBLY_ACC=CAM_ASM_000754 /LENGTH=196 /DNA_ID=CAMNT_0043223095 /DNA_START=66 /DNA_END=656 /DNA_ORIENTATION=-